ncbi:response regulator [Pseudoroseomonas globiformis]|uniref:histidine kinase n=1 Tax=Teichococcus globiformis TaxID=2307229 RepID=A0ABV7G210_9PROT
MLAESVEQAFEGRIVRFLSEPPQKALGSLSCGAVLTPIFSGPDEVVAVICAVDGQDMLQGRIAGPNRLHSPAAEKTARHKEVQWAALPNITPDEGETSFRNLADAAPILIWQTDPAGAVTFANRRFLAQFGSVGQTVAGEPWASTVHPDDLPTLKSRWLAAHQQRASFRADIRVLTRDGVARRIRCEGSPSFQGLRYLGHVCCGVDVTEAVHAAELLEARIAARTAELEQAEAALRQSQKMDAIGQLTGGIAHDFNNLLQGISGSLDLIQTRIAQGRLGAVEPFIKSAAASASRAKALTNRLLAFARKQPIDPRSIQPNDLIKDLKSFLRRSCGEAIRLELCLDDELWNTLCDGSQFENAILNLAINARDAMQDGGHLTVTSKRTRYSASREHLLPELTPGDYVCISVADTGCGMDERTVAKAFEPFFTTKPAGQGTGLGLSMIYGFARQAGGGVQILSRKGRGTTVELYLPRHDAPVDPLPVKPSSEAAAPADALGQVVVVVEDDPVVRHVMVEVLVEQGYAVLQAEDGAAAQRLIHKLSRLDLLITDIGLPGMNGYELADLVRHREPKPHILLTTGYAEEAAKTASNSIEDQQLLVKPFHLDELKARVRSLLTSEQNNLAEPNVTWCPAE